MDHSIGEVVETLMKVDDVDLDVELVKKLSVFLQNMEERTDALHQKVEQLLNE